VVDVKPTGGEVPDDPLLRIERDVERQAAEAAAVAASLMTVGEFCARVETFLRRVEGLL